MAVKERRIEPEIFLEGIDEVIKKDLGRHRELLARTRIEMASWRQAVKHESAKKRHYYRLIGKGKYDDDSLRNSVADIRINIRHLSDKVEAAELKIAHHTEIIDTLAQQLEDYDRQAERVAKANATPN